MIQKPIMKDKSIITHVCVYLNRALVTRQLELKDIDGDCICYFTDLPDKMIRDSVRVSGTGQLVLIDNNLSDIELEETSSEELNNLLQEIAAIDDEVVALELEMEKHVSIISFLDNLAFGEDFPAPPDLDYEKATSADFQKLFDFYSQESSSTKKEILSLEIKKREINRKRDKLLHDANRLQESSGRNMIQCSVNFRMKSRGDASIALSYVIEDASWSPLYDGRLLYREREFELISYADIEQTTGEDWNQVGLELSTANPVIGAHLPEPEPWYIKFFVPPPRPKMVQEQFLKKKGKREKMDTPSEEEMEDDFDLEMEGDIAVAIPAAAPQVQASVSEPEMAKAAAEVSEDMFSASTVKTAGLSAIFEIAASNDIPTDGTTKKIFVSLDRFPVRYEYIIMPTIEEAAYLKIIMKNSREYPLLEGPVKVYRDFDYVGDSGIEDIVPGEELELYMGVDDGIKVKREQVNRISGKKGLTGKEIGIEYTYRITIESYKDEKETVKLFEQVPLSRNKEIEVRIHEQGGFDDPDEKGILKKEFEIKPKEKKEIVYTYSVRYPADRSVSGIV